MKKIFAILVLIVIVLCLSACASKDYKEATTLYEGGNYESAAALFNGLGDYKNSADMYLVCRYSYAAELMEAKSYDTARAIFSELGSYEESESFAKECSYRQAGELFDAGNFKEALALYESISDYLDTAEKISVTKVELMYVEYADIFLMLSEGTWFYESGAATAVNSLTFTQEAALITQISYDGNGTHVGESVTFPYVVDESNITITLADGSDRVIPYSVEDAVLKLGDQDYFTPEDIDAALQGNWKYRKTSSWGLTHEYNYKVSKGTIKYENACEGFGLSWGEYYYYGPYSGTYEITAKGFSTTVKNSIAFGFSIVKGKVILLYFDHICSRGSGLKGQYGYSF